MWLGGLGRAPGHLPAADHLSVTVQFNLPLPQLCHLQKACGTPGWPVAPSRGKDRVPAFLQLPPLRALRCYGPTSACGLGWVGTEGISELTVAIAHEQHGMVDEPGAAEGPQWVGDPAAVELGGPGGGENKV